MIELHERLSEFSYGYGVTREVERALASIGITTAPFLPSLLQEAKLGFDVGFKKPGSVLLLQFKLGQSLQRFVKAKNSTTTPILSRPFWRFKVNTAEIEGQYETLVKAQDDGAETCYVAPRFVDWSEYLQHFESGKVLENSILLPPSQIRDELISKGTADGLHRIVYDRTRVHVCSEPSELSETRVAGLMSTIESQTRETMSLADRLNRVFVGLGQRAEIRRDGPRTPEEEIEFHDHQAELAQSRRTIDTSRNRADRLEVLTSRARSREDAIAAAIGVETWALGIQMVLATKR